MMKKRSRKLMNIMLCAIIIIGMYQSVNAINKTDEKNIYAYDNLNEQKSSMPSNIDGPWVYYGSLHGIFFIRGFFDIPAIRNGMGDLHILSHKKLTISGYEIIYDYWDGHIEEIRPISFSTKATSLDCFPFIGICRLGIITGITTHIDVWVIE